VPNQVVIRDSVKHVVARTAGVAVACEVGYENAFAFSAAFKRATGRSPTAWRR
jgi:AraC-like DNA-binding protein